MSNVKQQKQKITLHPQTPQQEVVVRLMVDLPEAIYDLYAEQAMKLGHEVEQVMSQRLRRFAEANDSGIYFSEGHVRRLRHIVGQVVSDAEGALQRMENVSRVKIGDIELELEAKLKMRLESRAKMRRMKVEDMIKKEVLLGLRRYVGLEPS